MRLSHHLVRHRAGIYHFRLIVPADLRERLERRVIKRSLRTYDPHAALAAALVLSAGYADLFARLRRAGMAGDKFSDLARDINQYVLDAERGTVQTDGTQQDHNNALEMAKAMLALRQAGGTPQAYGVSLPSTSAAAVSRVPTGGGKTLREAITHWETVSMGGMRLKATAEERQKIIENFAAHVGEKRLIAELSRADVASWIAYLRGTRKNTTSTANTKAGHIVALFESAKRAGYYPAEWENPANDAVDFPKSAQDARAETHGWQAFTLDQLKTIFAPENFRRTREIHTRRAMAIALYTGARVGEIAQLRINGFKTVGGHEVMNFEGELKTDASKRQIPIHTDLIRLGLSDWVSEQKKRGSTRLLPTVKLDGKSGKGNAISKGFSHLLGLLGVKPTIDADLALTKELDPIIGMHSFRDTLIQSLQGHVDLERRKAYVGHSYEGRRPHPQDMRGSHEASYMRIWTPEEIAIAFDGIHWGEWLDFDALHGLLKQSDEEHAQAMKTMRQREETRRRTAERKAAAEAAPAQKAGGRKTRA